MAEQGTLSTTAFVTRILAILLAGVALGTLIPVEWAPFCFGLGFLLTIGPWSR